MLRTAFPRLLHFLCFFPYQNTQTTTSAVAWKAGVSSHRKKQNKIKLPQVEIRHLKWIPDKLLSSGCQLWWRKVAEEISVNDNFSSNDTQRLKRQRNKQILRDVSFITGLFSKNCQQRPQNSVMSQRSRLSSASKIVFPCFKDKTPVKFSRRLQTEGK